KEATPFLLPCGVRHFLFEFWRTFPTLISLPSSSTAFDNRPLRRTVAAPLAISHDQHCTEGNMPVMQKLRMFVVQEPVVAASCLIAGVGLFLPAVVRPILDSFEASKQVPQPALSDVVAGMTGKKQG
ncbi:hypothetical protein F2P56_014557, partial [Juglans regia]